MAKEGPFYFQLPEEAGGGCARVNMDACRGHKAGSRKGKEIGTISARTGRPRKRHILDFSLDELRHLGWTPGGDVCLSHSQNQFFPYIPGYDSDSEESYAPVDEFRGFLPGGRISAEASYAGMKGGQSTSFDRGTASANCASETKHKNKQKNKKKANKQQSKTLEEPKSGATNSLNNITHSTLSFKEMAGDPSREVCDEFVKNAMHHVSNFNDTSEEIRQTLMQNGTNVILNDADQFGDGDQRPLAFERHRQAHRDIWCAGGDVIEYFESGAASAFARACFKGDIQSVRRQLQGLDSERLMQHLEKRETTMRLSPIFFCIIGRRHLPSSIAGADAQYTAVSQYLLDKGARPDARDFCGKTVVHYGAGGVATPLSLRIVDLCLAKSRQLGLVAPPLVDMPDRTGAVSFMDVIMMGRTDVARWLLARQASTSVVDLDGMTPAKMVNPLFNREMAVVFSEGAAARIRQNRKETKKCSHCGLEAGPLIHLQKCSACKKVEYCSRECQSLAWKRGHKQECESFASGTPIKLQQPDRRNQSQEEQMLSQWNVQLPEGKTYGERFWVKIQVPPPGGTHEPILIYDQTRRLQIHYISNINESACERSTAGVAELLVKVRAEGALGRKGFFEAYIDEPDSFFVDASHMAMKSW